MATLASVARDRKNALKSLQKASLKLDATQETVEREIKRLLTRKRSVPEAADMERVISQIGQVSQSLNDLLRLAQELLTLFKM